MSKLTRRAENGTAVYATPSGEPVKWENNRREVLQKLADYEDLEEQGLLLKLPCKIGTNKLYYIDDDKEIYRINGDEVIIKRFPNGQIIYDYDCCEFSYDDFGKTVFLTKEEAEEKLKELNINERN